MSCLYPIQWSIGKQILSPYVFCVWGEISWLYSKEMEIMLMNTASHRTWSSVLIYLLHKESDEMVKLPNISFFMTNDVSCTHIVLKFPNYWMKCGGPATSVIVNTAYKVELAMQTTLLYKLCMCHSDLITHLSQASQTFPHDRHMLVHQLQKVSISSVFSLNIFFTFFF